MKIEQSIRAKVEKAFAPVHFEIENESAKHHRPAGSETHFKLVVVSDHFEGVSRVERQRQVAALFDEEREAGLHALSQRVMTAKEWEAVKENFEMKSPTCRDGLSFDPIKGKK